MCGPVSASYSCRSGTAIGKVCAGLVRMEHDRVCCLAANSGRTRGRNYDARKVELANANANAKVSDGMVSAKNET